MLRLNLRHADLRDGKPTSADLSVGPIWTMRSCLEQTCATCTDVKGLGPARRCGIESRPRHVEEISCAMCDADELVSHECPRAGTPNSQAYPWGERSIAKGYLWSGNRSPKVVQREALKAEKARKRTQKEKRNSEKVQKASAKRKATKKATQRATRKTAQAAARKANGAKFGAWARRHGGG